MNSVLLIYKCFANLVMLEIIEENISSISLLKNYIVAFCQMIFFHYVCSPIKKNTLI
jgi:hypothetical protein